MSTRRKARHRKPERTERPASSPPPRPAPPAVPLWTWPLVALTVVGALLRGYYLRQPMRYDESVTYLYFAAKPWGILVSSYTYPNNHVFHSLLVKACVTVLGDAPWVIRLPAFAAGVAMIPFTYSVGRRLFGSAPAYIGAGLVAASGALVFYSANARGYTMVCLATLILADLLLQLREQPSTPRWVATVVTMALGAWTNPVMVYPAGGLALWFGLSALAGDTRDRRADVARLMLALLSAAILTLLLYSPIISQGGLSALTENAFVRSSMWRVFFHELSLSIGPALASSTLGYPVAIAVLVAVCAAVGLFYERRSNGIRVSLAGSMYVWCAVLLLVTHRTPFLRVWLFLVAPVALLAGHGLIRMLSLLPADRRQLIANAGVTSVGLAIALAVVVVISRAVETSRETGTLPDAERISSAFSRTLRPGDRIYAPVPSNAPLAYYLVRAGVDTSYLSATPADSARVYLIVNTNEGFTLQSPLGDRALKRFRRVQLMAKYPSAEIYRLF